MLRARLTAIPLSALVVGLLAACSTDLEPRPSLTSSPDPVVTVVVTESPEPSPSVEASEPDEPVEPAFSWNPARDVYLIPEDLGNADGTAFSGCSPDSLEVLPDGIWFGYPQEVTRGALQFDLYCYYVVGSEVYEARQREAQNEGNDWYAPVTNDSDNLYEVPVAPDAGLLMSYEDSTAEYIAWSGGGYDAWVDGMQFYLAWIVVNGGQVTEVIPVYVP